MQNAELGAVSASGWGGGALVIGKQAKKECRREADTAILYGGVISPYKSEMTLDYCFFCHDKKHFCVVKGHFCSFLLSSIYWLTSLSTD